MGRRLRNEPVLVIDPISSAIRPIRCWIAAIVLLGVATPALAAGDGEHHYSNHVALLVGSATEVDGGDRTDGGMLGIAYERKLSSRWHFAATFEQEAFGDRTKRHTVVFLGGSYSVNSRWNIFAGPGVEGREFGESDHFLFRLGSGYNFPLSDRWSLKPEFAIDLIDDGTQVYVFALALGYGF